MRDQSIRIQSVIVEDEKHSLDALQNYLAENCPDIEVVASAGTVEAAYREILSTRPALVFLDIDLPDGTAFDLLRKFPRVDFHIIFITGWDKYAVQAFRFFATDYLLKPVSISELVEAVEKVRKELAQQADFRNIEHLLRNYHAPEKTFDKIMINDREGYRLVPLHDIIYCEADAYCTKFVLIGGSRLMSTKHLKFYEELLEDQGFMRVHHSYLVNLAYITQVSNLGTITTADNHVIPLGDKYRHKVRRYCENQR